MAAQSPNWPIKHNALRPILQNCLNGLEERFGEGNSTLPVFKSCCFLSPARFPEIIRKDKDGKPRGIPTGALDHLCSLAGVDSTAACNELIVFAGTYNTLLQNIQADFPPSIDLEAFDVDFQV